jgi:hypothetical protein
MEFPPLNNTGVFRSMKFVKYLHKFDIEPVVITFEPEFAKISFKKPLDFKLNEEIPDGTCVYNISCKSLEQKYSNKLKRFITIYFSVEDSLANHWRKEILKQIPQIIEKHQPKLIIASLPPFSSGGLAAELSKKFRLPLIIDMRDGWSKWAIGPFGSWFHYYFTYKREKYIFKNSSAIVSVTKQLLDVFKKTHSEIEQSKFHLISNGYDKDIEYRELYIEPIENKNEFVIGYVGAFYYDPVARENMFKPWWKKKYHRIFQYAPVKEDWLYRSPYFFLKALSLLFIKRPDFKNKIKVKFIGDKPLWIDGMIKEFNLTDNCSFYGHVSYSESLKIQESFDAFLTTSAKVIDGEDYALPSKIFDYITSFKPIIGFVTKGSCQEFIENSGMGFVCDPDDNANSVFTLEKIICGNYNLNPNMAYLESFNRKVLTQNLALLIKKTISENKKDLRNS